MITSCAFSPDSTYLVSGSSRGELRLWDARYGHGKCLFSQIEAHDLGVSCCDFNPLYEINKNITELIELIQENGLTGSDNMSTVYIVASGGNDDLIKLWKIKAGINCSMHLCMTLEGHSANVMCCRFSSDGSLLASGAGDKSVIIRDAQTGEILTQLERHNRYITCCAFTSDNKYLATGSNDKTIILWSLVNSEISDESPNANNLSTSRICIGPSNHGVKSVSQWSVDNVCNWLEGLNLKEYEETFRNHAIDGKELLHLTHENLSISMKIDILGHRNKILRGIQALKNPLWQHQCLLEESALIPEEFFCPITHEKMIDPVVAMDGYSYERAAILEWIKNGNNTSPMTNEKLSTTEVIPNKTLRLIIQKYQ
ncbi:WD repeat, SAM and U-box domain-containing protein 1-like isoform X1 [Centruroides sculpturatus]|uniref:WD repeat, SAM and U-box domain-containing protein 1-like isoform X1 n=1 Tax=Centruroides sculpturatus TaxID=218467 RepID=UPI000C6E0681|nr:WD repeat, SAM and U-box domain-containing protein 1-like isoform X1 [Centruroides sculpturatus]